MDDLILKLKKTGFGCHIGKTFAGSKGYADDVVLLSLTLSSLKLMHYTYCEFGSTYYVRLTPGKFSMLHFPR